jgi:uncharacterized protein
LVFHPVGPPGAGWQRPELDYEDAWFSAADGTRLHGWYCAAENPRAQVLFAHGNAGNVTHRWRLLRMLSQQLGVSVLAFDHRGYGRSEGAPSEAGILADARAGRQWLAERAGIAESDVVLYGRSLGGGVVVDLAADGARGLILESTFTSLPDVARLKLPLLPVNWLMHNRLDSIEKIGRYRGPLLVAHGEADTLIPIDQGRRLFDAANEPKEFIPLPDTGHNWRPPAWYVVRLESFFAAL